MIEPFIVMTLSTTLGALVTVDTTVSIVVGSGSLLDCWTITGLGLLDCWTIKGLELLDSWTITGLGVMTDVCTTVLGSLLEEGGGV